MAGDEGKYMSVRTGDRDEGKLTAINASRLLVEYTYDRVHDKTLPKASRWLMSKSIWDDASLARAKLLRGNAIRVECTEDANERLLLLKEVIGHLDSLIANIDTLNIKKIITDRRAEYWTKLATDMQNLTKALLKSNRRDYKERGFLK